MPGRTVRDHRVSARENNASQSLAAQAFAVLFGKPDVLAVSEIIRLRKSATTYVRMNQTHREAAPRSALPLRLVSDWKIGECTWQTCKRQTCGPGVARECQGRTVHVTGELVMDEAVDQLRAAYDAVPYESHAFPQTAPGRLAAIAYLFGLDAMDVSTARVLEIGCAAGGNLLPFAIWHPQARVVGIDLSPVQVDQGRRRVQALGLANLELLQGDIAAMDLAALASSISSSATASTAGCRRTSRRRSCPPSTQCWLQGAWPTSATTSYPGWKAKEIVRDAMLLRGGDRLTRTRSSSYARGMIDFLEEVAPADSVLPRPWRISGQSAAAFRDCVRTSRVLGAVQRAVLLP